MSLAVRVLLAIVGGSSIALAGCGGPTPPTAKHSGPPGPPPPPVKVEEPKPAPPPQPDPFEVAVGEIGKVLQRFAAIGPEIKDEATADKAVEEMGRLNTRLKELAAEIGKIPYRPGDDKHMLALRAEMAKMTTQLSNS